METDTERLDRTTRSADVLGGKPIIPDMQVAVGNVLGMLAAGDTAQTFLQEYPVLEPEDIRACLVCSDLRAKNGRADEGRGSA